MTTPVARRPFVWRDGPGSPPLLMLHGTGGDEYDLLDLAGRLRPDSPVLSPRGMVLEGGAPRFFRRLREGVFDEDDLAKRSVELAEFVGQVGAEHDVPPGQFVAVGFSNGANIASAMLFTRPGILAGAVLIAAMVPFRRLSFDVDLTGKWVVISNGRRDPMIPAEQTSALAQRFRDAGALVHLLPHDGGHGVDPAQLAEIGDIIGQLPQTT
jgi:phospholipase/carboxylesterase